MNTHDKYELPPLPDCSLYISGQPGLCMINIDHMYELLTDYACEAIEVALKSQDREALVQAVQEAIALLEPGAPLCCSDCKYEWNQALRVLREAIDPAHHVEEKQ